jgi:hypothetical protein
VWRPEVLPAPKPRKVVYELPRLQVKGETFYIERDRGTYYIRHPRWSLLGKGKTVALAYKDLLAEAVEVRGVYRKIGLANLDQDAHEMYRFILRIA